MIVLDTHVLIRMDADDAALGPQARARIEQAWRAGEVAVSAISFWECAMLAEKGRIVLPLAIEGWRAGLLGAGLVEIALDGRIVLAAAGFADLHRDPADQRSILPRLRSKPRLDGDDTMPDLDCQG